jgi:hypothetical protein
MTKNQPYNLNLDGTFMSPEQIIEDILSNRLKGNERNLIAHNFNPPMTTEEKEFVRKTGFNPNAYARTEFGRWIRNAYGLWDLNNPHVVLNAETNEGLIVDPNFPDNLSGRIIDTIRTRLIEDGHAA